MRLLQTFQSALFCPSEEGLFSVVSRPTAGDHAHPILEQVPDRIAVLAFRPSHYNPRRGDDTPDMLTSGYAHTPPCGVSLSSEPIMHASVR
jgi:hypothetical protein